MKRPLLVALAMLSITSAFTGCMTHESETTPPTIRTGSGGRGMSTAQEAETSVGAGR
jgi:hypothetical protein